MTTVPAPVLASTTAPLAKPLTLRLIDVKFSDGTVAGEADVTLAGVLVFRGSPAELWDEMRKTWRVAPGDEELKSAKPLVAAFKAGGAPAWEATLVAVGQKDAADADVYKPAEAGTPTYFVRGLVKTTHAGVEETTLGAPSPTFTFVDESANKRFTTQFDTPTTKPDEAHKVRMQLKGDAMQAAGYLEIRAQPNFEVEIANCDGGGNVLAKFLLVANGDIQLTPAAGAHVIVEGDIETNRILYAPSGGGAKQWLS